MPQTTTGFTPEAYIALAALIFSVTTFAWVYLWKGRLSVEFPRRMAFSTGLGGRLVAELPLTFRNTGVAPVVIHDLRLILRQSPTPPLHFAATNKTFGELEGEGRAFATPFTVIGRSTLSLNCEFQRQPGMVFDARTYHFSVQAQVGQQEEWQELTAFIFRVEPSQVLTVNKFYLVYSTEKWQKSTSA